MKLSSIISAVLLASAAGIVTLTPAAAGDYVVGVIVPQSGQTAFIGDSALKAMTLRAEQINAEGGINGHKIKLDAQDEKCNPTTAVNIAQDGKGYASGTQLAEGSYFGRRAGRHAAGQTR